jgi:predicted signal transduction protein with EAL and GGDEF domain
MLLCAVAERLTSLLRYDSLARVGGDEFVAVLDRMRHADSAERIVERMLAAMQEPFVVQGVQLRATPSIGVAHFPQDGDDVESLIAHADVAMYAAKQSGRNGYSIYDTRMRERAERVMTIQRALLTAIEDGSLSLHFQPKHDSHTGAIVGAEALARWHHATLGNVPPIEFIGVAERSGQIGRIGEWVIRESCRQLSEWRARGLAPVRIAINLSPLQLNQPGLVETAARIAAEAHVDPAQIMFEVTETMAMENAERTTLMLKDFRARGFEFAIDDFGTGYSSLAYLQKFQVRQLKIDQFFIQALEDGGPEARAIIAAIIELAHTLNMEVVAEGVETQLQADLLRTLGCDQVQGYYLSMPMPPGEFEQRYLTRTAADCALAD